MAAFGGYWRPLAAVARLLEELGELSDELRAPDGEPGAPGGKERKIAAELADLWIITAALADQFLGEVAEPSSRSLPPQDAAAPADAALTLLAAAGSIARIVNYYDGPKTPRSLDGWISLERAVQRFHDELATVAIACRIDLHASVQAKLEAIPALDSGRFSATWHDPATARCLDDFRRLPGVAGGPLASARLWGGPDWRPRSLAANVDMILPSLTSFAKAAPIERLDAYVIPGPHLPSAAACEEWLGELLVEISAREPRESAHQPRNNAGASAKAALNRVQLDAKLICTEQDDSVTVRPSAGSAGVISFAWLTIA